MGIPVTNEREAEAAIEELDADRAARTVEPVQVTRSGTPIAVRLKLALGGGASWELELVREDGTRERHTGRATSDPSGVVELPVPRSASLPEGYHQLHARVRVGGRERRGTQWLIVTPGSCLPVGARLEQGRGFGVLANLYTLRSAANWGVGDLGDLRRLADWTRDIDAAFVGIGPLHATGDRAESVSPYYPTSRLYRNAIYLDVRAIPEFESSDEGGALLASDQLQRALTDVREDRLVDFQRIWNLKRPVFEALHRTFVAQHGNRDTARARAYAEYRRREGAPLDAFATYCALDEAFGDASASPDWRTWPAEFHDPDSAAVAAFAHEHRGTVDLHRWLQFETERQLRHAGEPLDSRLGLYHDLATGSAPGGSDHWTWRRLFVSDAAIGAPPDDYAAEGQNWGLPPLHPLRLREDAYAYWTRLLRTTLACAGVLRIDHVMGLFRLFWIPAGRPASEGAYVRYPAEDLFGILALESRRHGAVVIGEDLGTVPPEVPDAMRRWGLLGSRVLYFQHGHGGEFLPAEAYPADALATISTHDHVPLAGFWEGTDVELRKTLGLATASREEREGDRAALQRRLEAEGSLDTNDVTPDTVLRAAHAFLAHTPSVLVGIAFDDLGGEMTPVNIPGVGPDRYPVWQRKMTRTVEDILTAERTRRALEPLARRRVGSVA